MVSLLFQANAFVIAHATLLFGLVVAGSAGMVAARATFIARATRRRRRQWAKRQSDLRTVRALSCWEWEILVGEVLRGMGNRVEDTGGGGADGGIDHILYEGGRKVLVQDKFYRTKPVGPAAVRELAGVVMREKAHSGILVTVGTFSAAARKEATRLPVRLIDGVTLLRLHSQVLGPAKRQAA